MNYGEVLTRAWRIIWTHKSMWIFGILASCSGGGGGGGGNSFQFSGGEFGPRAEQFFERTIGRLSETEIALLIGLFLLIVLAIALLAIFLGTIGRIGLIQGTLQAEQGEISIRFGEVFGASLPYFWRVFGLNLLVGLALLVLGLPILLAFAGLIFLTAGIAVICLIPLICLLIPLFYALRVVLEQSSVAIVSEDLDVIAGLQRGWTLFRENLGPMILMGLILILGVETLGGLIVALPVLIIVIPAAVAVMAGGGAAEGGLLIAGLCLLVYLPVLIVLTGMLRAYTGSSWTLTYLRLTGTGPEEFEPAAG